MSYRKLESHPNSYFVVQLTEFAHSSSETRLLVSEHTARKVLDDT